MRIYTSRPILDRFNEKWIPEPFSGCWLWTGGIMVGGYGQIFIRNRIEGGKLFDGAHRVSWKLFRGEILDGLRVCHKCDTPSCVNPDHLFLGTAAENTHDSIKKGRFVFKPEGTGKRWHLIRKVSGNRRRGVCHQGHHVSGENMYITPDGKPRCLICIRRLRRRSNEKKKALRQ